MPKTEEGFTGTDVVEEELKTDFVENQEEKEVETETTPEEKETGTEKETTETTEEVKPDPLSEVLKKVEDLNKAIKDKDARIEALEGKAKEKVETPVEQKAPEHIKIFVNQFLPKAQEVFTKEDATDKDRFEVMVEVADKMIGAVISDKIAPGLGMLVDRIVEVSNRLEAAELSSSDPNFSELREEVFGILKRLPMAEREKLDAVSSIYGQLKGKIGKKQPEKKTVTKEVLRDVGGGSNGSGAGKGVVVLSAEQEEDRKQISSEAGHDMSPADYKMKYDAKVKYFKSQNKKVPATLRDY